MASRQQPPQRPVAGTHVSRPVRVNSSSVSDDDDLMRYYHYSVIGLRTWGQNYYDTVVKNSLAASAGAVPTATPSPQKKPIDLRVSIPQEHINKNARAAAAEPELPEQECHTPETEAVEGHQTSLPSTVSKHLGGMFDDIMKEVFQEDPHNEVAQETCREEEGFRIAACPSPMREAGSFRQPMMEERSCGGDHVVLNMEDMSPLLERMREIDRARNGNITLPSSTNTSPNDVDEAVDLEMQNGAKRVPSLVHFFDSRQYSYANKALAHAKPPLPKSNRDAKRWLVGVLGSTYSKKIEQVGQKLVLPFLQRTATPSIKHSRRMIFSMIALAYLVAIHVYLISSKL